MPEQRWRHVRSVPVTPSWDGYWLCIVYLAMWNYQELTLLRGKEAWFSRRLPGETAAPPFDFPDPA